MRFLYFLFFVIPALSTSPSGASPMICKKAEFQTESFWRKRVDDRIVLLTKDQPPEAANAIVTLSYLELFRAPSRSKSASFMGYVYSNASHHLGRLVRFSAWTENHPLKAQDREPVTGRSLRFLSETVPGEPSTRLMFYSLDLYRELAWNLSAAATCGNAYAKKLVSDQALKAAYASATTEEFVQNFITFEQTYLQGKMYRDLMIGMAARMRMLDEMRFISFNGEEQLSFSTWCSRRNCQTSSYDLKHRIDFDVAAILDELAVTGESTEVIWARILGARIEATARIFLPE